jgi:hypothetical protein
LEQTTKHLIVNVIYLGFGHTLTNFGNHLPKFAEVQGGNR